MTLIDQGHLAAPTPSSSRSPYLSPVASTANSSSSTLHEQDITTAKPSSPKHVSTPLPPTLEAECERDERRLEEFGADDPHPPPPKNQTADELPPPSVEDAPDANLVTWDGPDDPENPQNWSRFKKWVVTWTCVILSINV
jgi:hypothetical protein